VLATVGGLLRIAFFLAIAFFLFLLWRERRSDIEAWSDRSRNVFYAAVILAVVDIGALIGLGASGRDALAFFLVLGACVYAAVRVWREEHRYS
jgi:quinol-cytochrome oxidoreductase complex cytochrome b subunit